MGLMLMGLLTMLDIIFCSSLLPQKGNSAITNVEQEDKRNIYLRRCDNKKSILDSGVTFKFGSNTGQTDEDFVTLNDSLERVQL